MEPEEPIAEQRPAPTLGQELRREITELVKLVGLFLVLFIGMKAFLLEGYEVQGPSMSPTLEDRERILVWKLPHQLSQLSAFSWLRPFAPNDIVVFDSSVEPDKRYIKRVLAAGPAPDRSNTAVASTPESEARRVKVVYDRGEVYVDDWKINQQYLQEPETHSADTRDAVFLGPGEYYVMGDHRSVSRDSRSFGAIREDDIVGKAVFRFWPLNRIGFIESE